MDCKCRFRVFPLAPGEPEVVAKALLAQEIRGIVEGANEVTFTGIYPNSGPYPCPFTAETLAREILQIATYSTQKALLCEVELEGAYATKACIRGSINRHECVWGLESLPTG